MEEAAARQGLVRTMQGLAAAGLVGGASGNASVRLDGERMLITPSGIPAAELTPDGIAVMPLDGAGSWQGPLKPSSEWRIHLDILRARPATGAVVHAHPLYGTALAMARRDIPAGHYMVAAFGGADVRCAPYAAFGSQALSDLALAALQDREACLLANHGTVALGRDLDEAAARAAALETLAAQHWHALAIGGPVVLGAAEMDEVLERFKGYGQRRG